MKLKFFVFEKFITLMKKVRKMILFDITEKGNSSLCSSSDHYHSRLGLLCFSHLLYNKLFSIKSSISNKTLYIAVHWVYSLLNSIHQDCRQASEITNHFLIRHLAKRLRIPNIFGALIRFMSTIHHHWTSANFNNMFDNTWFLFSMME